MWLSCATCLRCGALHAKVAAACSLFRRTAFFQSLTNDARLFRGQVNYGLLTRNLVQSLIELGGDVQLLSTVTALQQQADKTWLVAVRKNDLTPTNQVLPPLRSSSFQAFRL